MAGVFLAAVAPGLGASASGAVARAKPVLDVLVVAGQSNALGYQSFVTDPVTHADVFTDKTRSAADSRVLFMWTESGVPSNGAAPVKLDAPQDLVGAPGPIFGPEVGLARALWAEGHHSLLVVKVAYSGSGLAEDWMPGDADFQALVARVQQAVAWADQNGFEPRVDGLYWMQGETDAMSATTAAAYGANLSTFLKAVRTDLPMEPRAPIVLGVIDLADYVDFEIGHHLCPTASCGAEKRWNDEVMTAQERAASRDDFVTKTASLPRYEDFIHLTDAAELALGKAFGQLSGRHLG